MQVKAIHHIMRSSKATPSSAAPGTVFECEGDELEHLLKARAVAPVAEPVAAGADVSDAPKPKKGRGKKAEKQETPSGEDGGDEETVAETDDVETPSGETAEEDLLG